MIRKVYGITFLILVVLLCCPALSKEKRYTYTFIPDANPQTFVMDNLVVVSSKGLTVTLEQIDRIPFARRFPVFCAEPDIYFFYFRITIRNRTGAAVEMNPIFFFALNDRKEFKKPLNYDEVHRILSKLHKPEEFRDIFQGLLVDFMSPIPDGGDCQGYLIFRNFRDKARTAVIKLDNLAVGAEPVSFSIPYTLERKVVVLE